jgi:hypothetical protein
MKLYGREYTKDELLTYIGDLSQIGGIEAIELTEGAAKEVWETRVNITNESWYDMPVTAQR